MENILSFIDLKTLWSKIWRPVKISSLLLSLLTITFLRLKSALMIPTPGQTEQEYLAKHLKQSGLFYIAEQKKLNLFNELKKIDNSDKIKKFNIATNDINKFRDIINV